MGFVHERTDYPGRPGDKVQISGESIVARFGPADANGATLLRRAVHRHPVGRLLRNARRRPSADTRVTLTHAPKPIR